MNNNEHLIPIPGRLHSVATDGHVAGADEIYDDAKGKSQANINSEVFEALGEGGSVDTKIENAINTLDATISQTAEQNNGGLNLQVTETNGKVTSISGSINPNTYDEYGAASEEATRAKGAETELDSRVTTNEGNIEALQEAYRAITQSQPIPKTSEEWAAMTSWEEGVVYRVQGTTSYADYMYNGTITIKMAEYDNAIDDEPTAGSDNLVKSGGVFNNIGAIDISELNATENPHTLATYEDLSSALSALPDSYRKGGMSVKFIQSNDNSYVQYILTADSFSTTISDWRNLGSEITDLNLEIGELEHKIYDVTNTILSDGSGWYCLKYLFKVGKIYRISCDVRYIAFTENGEVKSETDYIEKITGGIIGYVYFTPTKEATWINAYITDSATLTIESIGDVTSIQQRIGNTSNFAFVKTDEGCYVNTIGGIVSNSTYNVDTYTLNNIKSVVLANSVSSYASVVFLGENDKILLAYTNSDAESNNDIVLSVPFGTIKMLRSYNRAYSNKVLFTYMTIFDIINNLDKIANNKGSYVLNETVVGKYITLEGNFVDNTNYNVNIYKVYGIKQIKTELSFTDGAVISFNDVLGNTLSYYQNINDESSDYVTIDVPIGTTYIYRSFSKTKGDNTYFIEKTSEEYLNSLDDTENDIKKNVNDIVDNLPLCNIATNVSMIALNINNNTANNGWRTIPNYYLIASDIITFHTDDTHIVYAVLYDNVYNKIETIISKGLQIKKIFAKDYAGLSYIRFGVVNSDYSDYSSEIKNAPLYISGVYLEGLTKEGIIDIVNGKSTDVSPIDYKGDEIRIFNKIVCIGDSLTEGAFNYKNGEIIRKEYSYPTKLSQMLNVEVINLGDSGADSVQWWNKHQSEDLSGYDCAIIQLGVNDSGHIIGGSTDGTTSYDESKTALLNIINKLKTENNRIKIFLGTIISPFYYDTWLIDNGYQEGYRQMNTIMAEIANSQDNVFLVDNTNNSVLHNDKNNSYSHLTALGYMRLAKEYYAQISYIIKNNESEFKYQQLTNTDNPL